MKRVTISLKIDSEIHSVLKLFAKMEENSVSGVARKIFKDHIIERWKRSSDPERKQIEKARKLK